MTHKIGTVLRIKETLPSFKHRRGLMVQIKGPLATYHGRNEAGKKASMYGYACTLLGCTTEMTITADHLEPLPLPSRGDLDTKVSWADMPYKKRDEDLL